jgi:NAD dependent epimerase/dehydratase family
MVHGLPVVQADLNDAAAATRLFAGCDAVVHLAGYAGPYKVAGHEVFANNTRATYHVLAATAHRGVGHAVIASSTAAYGFAFARRPTSPQYVPVDEDHPLLPQDPYALSRLVDEQTGAMFARACEMAVVALRFHWLATDEELHARVAAVARNAAYGRSVGELWGYVHIADAARACRAALDVKRAITCCMWSPLTASASSRPLNWSPGTIPIPSYGTSVVSSARSRVSGPGRHWGSRPHAAGGPLSGRRRPTDADAHLVVVAAKRLARPELGTDRGVGVVGNSGDGADEVFVRMPGGRAVRAAALPPVVVARLEVDG